MTTTQTAEKAGPQVSVRDLKVTHPNDWCPGCGDFGILNSVYQAVSQLNIQPHDLAVFGGIGCSGKAPYYVNAYGIHTLHGRVLPFATGAKIANPELTVIAVGGDGDGLAIGAGHFVAAGRRNVDMTYILFNNEVYGLTKGQASPTLAMGLQTKSLPEPNIQGQINSLMLALTSGFSWIGRGYSYNVKQLISLMKMAVEHKGLSYLEVIQPCPTYNNLHNKDFYAGDDLASGRTRLYDLAEDGYNPVISPDHDPDAVQATLSAFMRHAHEWGEQIPTGVFLDNRAATTFAERIAEYLPEYAVTPPARRSVSDGAGHGVADLSAHFEEVRV
jgi:2-oxoglutarate ferredoxin oxidoreductase subunit beta